MAVSSFSIIDIAGELFLQDSQGNTTELTSETLNRLNIQLETTSGGGAQFTYADQLISLPSAQYGQLLSQLNNSSGWSAGADGEVYDTSLAELDKALNEAEAGGNSEQDFLAALEGDGDILENMEATAAGIGSGGGADGGNSFVRVSRIAEEVDSARFEFTPNTNEVSSPEPLNPDITSTVSQPSLTVDIPAQINLNTAPITGQTSLGEGDNVIVVLTDENGDNIEVITPVDEQGAFTVELPGDLEDGNFTGEVTISDESGNTVTEPFNTSIDRSPPELTIDAPGITNGEQGVISGTSGEPAGTPVTIVVEDATGQSQTLTVALDETGNFSIDIPGFASEGEVTVTATITDTGGNTTTVGTSALIDNTAPQLFVENPGTINNNTPSISGSTDEPEGSLVSITLTDAAGQTQQFTAEVQGDGTFSAQPSDTLAEGNFVIEAQLTDSAGNTTQATVNSGSIDTEAPTVSFNPIIEQGENSLLISGTTDAPIGSEVTIVVTTSDSQEQVFNIPVDADGNFEQSLAGPFAEGNVTATAQITDEAGNIGTGSVTYQYSETPSPAPAPIADGQDTPSDDAKDNSGNDSPPTDDNESALSDNEVTVTLEVNELTNDTTPAITGQSDAVAGTEVTITVTDNDGNTQMLTAQVDTNGNFSATPDAPLAEGSFTVSAQISDAAGNTASDSQTGTVDTTAPSLQLDAASPTNDTTPAITGQSDAVAGTEVTITVTDNDGNTQVLTAQVDATGNFSASPDAPLAEGSFTVSAQISDAAGNTASDSRTGTVDTTAPSLQLDAAPSNDTTPAITGQSDAVAGTEVTITVTDNDGNTQMLTAQVDATGNFSASPDTPLAEGSFTVWAQISDAAGNTASASQTGTVDTTAPSLQLDAASPTNDTTPAITGQSDAVAGTEVTITVTDNDGNTQVLIAQVDANGNFSASPDAPLAEGSFTVSAQISDAAGNTASDSQTGTVDTTAPSLQLDAAAPTNDTTPAITGRSDAVAGTEVTITVTDNDGNTQVLTAQVDTNGNFSASPDAPLAEGSFTVSVQISDAAGNTASASQTGTVDTTAPSLQLDAASSTNDTTPAITGQSDAVAGTEVTITVTDNDGNTQVLTAQVDATGNFSASPDAPLAEGSFTVSAQVSDAAGNTASASQTGTVDTTAPSLQLDAAAPTNDTTPAITGQSDAVAGTEVTITVTDNDGNTQMLTAQVDATGNFSASPDAPLAEGSFTVSAQIGDAAGNSTSTTQTGTVDTVAPDIVLAEQGNTGDATPIITGTSDLPLGSIITLQVTDSAGSIQRFDTTVNADGSFSAETPTPLAEGNYTIVAQGEDVAGNQTIVSDNKGTVDTSAPLINLNIIGDTNDPTPTIEGATDVGVGVSVAVIVTDALGNTQTLSATVNIDGEFSVVVPNPLVEGTFTVHAQVTDGSTSDAFITGRIDLQPPTLFLDAIEAGSTTPLISGISNEIGATVTLTVTDSSGTEHVLSAVVQADGTFGVRTPVLPEGTLAVSAEVLDGSGNLASVSVAGLVDVTIPTLILDPVEQGSTTPLISGISNEIGATVTLTVTDASGIEHTLSAVVQADGTFGVRPPVLPEGSLAVSAEVLDASGNLASVSVAGLIDVTIPTLILDPVEQGSTTPLISGISNEIGATVTLTVTDSSGTEYTLSAVVQADGTFGGRPPVLPEGSLTVSAEVLDASGNLASVSVAGLIDVTIPTLILDPVEQGSTTPLISGISNEIGATVTLTVTDSSGTKHTLSAVVQADGTFGVRPPVLPEGSLTVSAEVLDASGNLASVSVAGLIDVTIPTLILDPVEQGSTTPLISGISNEIGATVTLTVTDSSGTEHTLSAVVQADGTFGVRPPVLPEGSLTVSAQVLDASGNLASVSVAGLIDVTIPSLILDPVEQGSTTPLISGISNEIGATVTLTVTDSSGTEYTLSAVVQADGTFGVRPPVLPEGSLAVSAEVLDASGNLASVSVAGLVDVTIPTLILDPVEQGSTTPLISGISNEIGATVTLTVTDSSGTEHTLSAVVQADGTFGVRPPVLPEGSLAVSAEVLDASGNLASVSVNSLIDILAPSLTVNIVELNSSTPVISGTSNEIGGIVELVLLDAAGNSQLLNVEVDGTGTFSVTPAFVAEGQLNVSATIGDNAGNLATASTSGFIDITIPTLSLDAIGLINDTTPTISGNTDEHNGLVELIITDAQNTVQTVSVVADDVGNFVLDIPQEVAQGLLSIEANVTDAAGNSVDALSSATIDTVAPVLEITSLPTLLKPTITGVTDPSEAGRSLDINLTVNILGIETTLNINTTVLADGSWSSGPIANLTIGPVSATVAIIDEAGNLATVSGSSTGTGTPGPGDTGPVSGDLVSVNLLSGAVMLDV